GKLFADTSIFLICSTVLFLFNINKASKNGVVVEPAVRQTSGTVTQPSPFECTVALRSDEARSLIDSARGAS
ncbi:hypothetical protein B0H13DRAFT_1622609, partial [Mycena leptocephala]